MSLRTLLEEHKNNVALVVGNGINRYGNADQTNSWNDLLLSLADKHGIAAGKNVPDGIALTEFYDLLELKRPAQGGPTAREISFQKDFCAGMAEWQVYPHHISIVRWAHQNGVPIMTTNFDNILARAGSCRLLPKKTDRFTHFYPWERYYGDGDTPIASPDRGFGIWHINGMQKYHRSVRLGLTHYMGSVQRVRGWLHKGEGDRRLFEGKDEDNWSGAGTWLHIIFNKPLLIFGLALEENEVFLRWLLIERARYFRKFSRQQEAWYVYASDKEREGKLYFLEGIGIKPIKVETYDDIYGGATWT